MQVMSEWLCSICQLIRVSESDRAALCADAETFSCNTGDVLSNQFVFHLKQMNVLHTQLSINLNTLLDTCQCSVCGSGSGDDDDGDDGIKSQKVEGRTSQSIIYHILEDIQ